MEVSLSGWGRYPVQRCRVYRPESLRALKEVVVSGEERSVLARGLGRAYGDAALNEGAGVILQTRRNRFLNFDEAAGVLRCEAGVSLAEILDVFVPRGYFLPVTPGTKFVTLGGAIASDVHGKNHHKDGSISNFILDFDLLTADGEIVRCTPRENADLFWATVGGMGLTGVILRASLRLVPISSSYLRVDYFKARNIDEAFEVFEATDEQYQYSVAWIDCLAGGRSLGRSVLMRGNHVPAEALPEKLRGEPLATGKKGKLVVPFDFPSVTLNYASIRAFNALYYRVSKGTPGVVVHYDPFFYPLDSVLHWNRLYGRRGFLQYQVVFPFETSREGLIALLERLAKDRRSSFLAVLKRFGAEGPGLLSFPRPGYTLALDIPFRDAGLFGFLREMDEWVLRMGGRVYLTKDAELAPEIFEAMYPRLGQFREVKGRIDPENRFSSSLARRLRVVEGVQ
ncbi:FAD-binding protein [Kyrpidia spormannii]|uniref:Decaprenylphosphoryl-beta-D-ribose oxidase n=1 Tax=Kyrpidia spormannii TaxID=2055160 RepID=A0ACA8ZDU7_9BACL|nr:FAD-binding oxidoreductase [Kyrpidia spormannii]CAB3395498.1 Decaprenylphosphoryl-beta-D-ribose oxidase [Kyrpidia spormannii]